jgi:Flp pilus assembly protein TadD
MQEVAEQSPNDPDVMYNLGILSYTSLADIIALLQTASGKLEAALSAIDLALKLNVYKPEYHNLKGTILSQLGQKEEACKAFREAIYLDSKYPHQLCL